LSSDQHVRLLFNVSFQIFVNSCFCFPSNHFRCAYTVHFFMYIIFVYHVSVHMSAAH
jgi:hypothetical protein